VLGGCHVLGCDTWPSHTLGADLHDHVPGCGVRRELAVQMEFDAASL